MGDVINIENVIASRKATDRSLANFMWFIKFETSHSGKRPDFADTDPFLSEVQKEYYRRGLDKKATICEETP